MVENPGESLFSFFFPAHAESAPGDANQDDDYQQDAQRNNAGHVGVIFLFWNRRICWRQGEGGSRSGHDSFNRGRRRQERGR